MTELLSGIKPQVFRNTGQHTGWREAFSPETGAMQYLSFARFVCGDKAVTHTLETVDKEWMLFCIQPALTVKVGGNEYVLEKSDMLYLPRECTAVISGSAGCDIAASGCPAHITTEPQLVRFSDIKDDPTFFFDVGEQEMGTKRRIYNMLGHNVKASRLLAGWTRGEKTAWTSWPPHEHSSSKEEFYLFFDMPPPAFSVQFVFSSLEQMEFKEIVRDGDVATVPGGYHPTAAAPGCSSCFLWVMAAYDPEKDRDFKHGIKILPEFQSVKFV